MDSFQHQSQDASPAPTQGAQDSDLTRAFVDRHQHRVQHAHATDDDCHEGYPREHIVGAPHIRKLINKLTRKRSMRLGELRSKFCDNVPGLIRIAQFKTKKGHFTRSACQDLGVPDSRNPAHLLPARARFIDAYNPKTKSQTPQWCRRQSCSCSRPSISPT